MAVGKSKRVMKKGAKKKVGDFMLKKEWYDIKPPTYFDNREVGKTLVNRTAGTRIASEGLKGRVFEVSLADLDKDSDDKAFRKMRLISEDVQGRNVLLNFHGMTFTTDKLRSLVRKWHSLIECITEVKTQDGYTLRVFAIGFTKKLPNSFKKASYAQSAQVRQIRAKMVEIISREVTNGDLKSFVKKLKTDTIGQEIEKSCETIYPLQNVFVRKVKVLKKPKFDIARLLEIHNETSSAGAAVDRPADFVEPTPLASV